MEEYTSAFDKILFACKVCGTRWKAMPTNILKGTNCPTCGRIAGHKKKTLSQEEFEEQVYANNKSVKIISKYTATHDKVTCECLTCGRIYEATASNVARGARCIVCERVRLSAEHKLTNDEFLQRIDNNIITHNEYDGVKTQMKCECKICGNTWETGAQSLMRGHGCPNCARLARMDLTLSEEERVANRQYPEYNEFINNVFKRDNGVCQLTFNSGNVVVHHLNGYNWCVEGRTDINNAITISDDMHKEFHSRYGYGNNTKQQFVEFVDDLYKDNRITRNAYEWVMSERLK